MKKEKSIFDKHREEIAKRNKKMPKAMRDVMNPVKVYDILRDPNAAEKIAADNKPDPEETYYKGYTAYLERFSALDSDGLDGSEL